MNNILAIDSATQLLTISLKCNDIFFEKVINEGFSHSENLIPSIIELLNEADIKVNNLNLLICTRGPGSFTGLRISMATLKGISLALKIPLVSIPTLDVYAANLNNNGVLLPIIDAKKKCFYTAIYKNNTKITYDMDINLSDLLELLANENDIYITGPDKDIFLEKVKNDQRFKPLEKLTSYTYELINLGIKQYEKVGPDTNEQGPTYIRKSDAEIYLKNK